MRLFVCLIGSMLLFSAVHAEEPNSSAVADPDQAIVVTQGEAAISVREVDAFAQRIPEDKRGPVFNDPHRIEDILNGLLSQQQLAAEARSLGLDQEPLIKAQMKLAAVEVLAQARLETLRAKIETTVPDVSQLAHERYIANPDQYAVPASVDVKHILIGTKDRSETEAKTIAEKLYAELMQDPSTFAAKIEKFSDDPSKSSNHGLITGATTTRVVAEFRQAAEALADIGDISPPVKTTFGYHILKLVERTPAHQRSFEEVREEMIKELENEYVAKQVQVHLAGLRGQPMDANPELVASLRLRYFDESAARALRAHYADDPVQPAPATSTE